MQPTEPAGPRIDIISDVVCPWCYIGISQIRQAMDQTGIRPEIVVHPFELNPQMPREGQNLRAHLTEKYGSTDKESTEIKSRIRALGAPLGITFKFSDTARMPNTFRAHQLIEWADGKGRQIDTKLALFKAYFTDERDLADIETLADIAGEIGLERDAALAALSQGTFEQEVRTMEKFWTEKGIHSVPAMVFNLKNLVSGAQGTDAYGELLARFGTENAS